MTVSEKTRAIVWTGMFAAIIAVMAQIAIPLPSSVPITLQTFAIALCGYFMQSKKGTASVLVYLMLGAVGIPVFANFKGGLGVLIGVTGGFLYGFLLMAFLCGLSEKAKAVPIRILLGLCGLAAAHIAGIIHFSLVTSNSFGKSFLLVSLPYLLKDAVSVVCAYFFAELLKKRIRRI